MTSPHGSSICLAVSLRLCILAPTRRRTVASRHLVCESCSCGMQFDSSGCTHSWTEMTGSTRVFTCRGCRKVARLVGEVEDLRKPEYDGYGTGS